MPQGYLGVNASHATAGSGELIEALIASDPERIVVEITEHEPIEDYDELGIALERLRGIGVRIAIDDAGAGFASLRHILQLSPDIIKLDISITSGIDHDRARRAMSKALISFADEMGMTIVAEGLETQPQIDTPASARRALRAGFFLSRGRDRSRPPSEPASGGPLRVGPRASMVHGRRHLACSYSCLGGPGGVMERIRVLVAEDEEAVREALVDLLTSDAAIDVVGSAKDADEAIEMAASSKPDVALVDVKMPGGGGVRAAREIRANSPQTHVVALSAYEDRRTVLEMLRAGAVGYVVKGTSADEILRTIRRSLRGQGSLSVEVTADVIRELVALLDRSEALSRDLQELDSTKSETDPDLVP